MRSSLFATRAAWCIWVLVTDGSRTRLDAQRSGQHAKHFRSTPKWLLIGSLFFSLRPLACVSVKLARIRREVEAGEVPVRDLSQRALLSSALGMIEDTAAGAPLAQLRVLVPSEVFHRILKKEAIAVRDGSESEKSASSHAMVSVEESGGESAEEELDTCPLGIHDVLDTVVPRALTRWKSLVKEVLSEGMASEDACELFRREAADRREIEVRLMVLVGAEPMVGVSDQIENSIISSDGDVLLERLRECCRLHGGAKARHAERILASLEARDSIDWFIENVAGLLRAHRVLHSPTAVSVDRDGEDRDKEAEGLGDLFDDDEGEGEDGQEKSEVAAPQTEGDSNEGSGLEGEAAVEVMVTKIFADSPDLDPFRQHLQEMFDDIQSRSRSLSMAEATEVWGRVNRWSARHDKCGRGLRELEDAGGLVQRARTHVELLIKLSEYPRLVKWLTEVRVPP